MKYKLNLMMLAVAALVYGLCGTAQAVDTTITFGAARTVQITQFAEHTEGDYTYATDSSLAYYIDSQVYKIPQFISFVGAVVVDWGFEAPGPMRIWRTDDAAFSAKSIRLGAYNGGHSRHAWVTVTGYFDGGGTVETSLYGFQSQATTNYLYGFSNITNLEILGEHDYVDDAPAFDDVVLTDELTGLVLPDPAVIGFEGTAVNTNGGQPLVVGEIPTYYTEKGYIMMPTAGGVYFKHTTAGVQYTPFDDSVLALWSVVPDGAVRFTRADSQPFSAMSLAVGAIGAGEVDVIGNLVGGGSVTNTFTPADGSKTNETLSGFTNLTSLDMDLGLGLVIIDDITLEVFTPALGGIVIELR